MRILISWSPPDKPAILDWGVDLKEFDLRRIEEAALNAWPAASAVLYDGWLLRFHYGYTRRANSVNPLYPSSLELDEKIAYCEASYHARGLPPVFRLAPQAQAEGLETILVGRGYLRAAETEVQARWLAGWQPLPAPQVEFQIVPVDDWLAHFCAFKGQALAGHQAHRAILDAIPGERCLGLLAAGEHPVACGLGVRESAYLGLFDLVTDPAARNRGYGRLMVEALVAWGINAGAGLAYLQVESSNAPALHLYNRLGFAKIYSYWYRVAPSREQE